MALKRRYAGGRRFRRRTRRRFGRRPRYSRYLRKRSRIYRRKRGGVISKMLKSLLPTVPIKYCQTYYGIGAYGSRTWFSDTIGNVADAYSYRDYLPGQSNIFDDGSTGTSTHLTFQQFAMKRLKLRHVASYVGQNVANTTMILTAHICQFRRDYNAKKNPSVLTDFLNVDAGTSTNSGAYKIDSHSSLPATSYIGKYSSYPQFNAFMSPEFCSNFLVVKTKKYRIPPGGWFKFKLNTGYKEFERNWLVDNNGLTQPLQHLRKWSKFLVLTWHGELVQQAATLANTTLSATDFQLYANHSLTLKAVPYHKESVVLLPPVNMVTTSPLPFLPQVRPKVVVQVTKTSTAVEDDAP